MFMSYRASIARYWDLKVSHSLRGFSNGINKSNTYGYLLVCGILCRYVANHWTAICDMLISVLDKFHLFQPLYILTISNPSSFTVSDFLCDLQIFQHVSCKASDERSPRKAVEVSSAPCFWPGSVSSSYIQGQLKCFYTWHLLMFALSLCIKLIC